MLPTVIRLVDLNRPLVQAWREAFADEAGVEVLNEDLFVESADALVSPANSFGIMDGGVDLAIRSELGFQVQTNVQKMIVERYHGEIPVGQAEVVRIGNDRFPYIVSFRVSSLRLRFSPRRT